MGVPATNDSAWYMDGVLVAVNIEPANERYRDREVCLYIPCIGSCVDIITGRGVHSKGKEARIKPAVLEYLQRNGFV